MKSKRKAEGIIRQRLERQGVILPGLPIVELTGEGRVLIENHRGICAYQREEVVVEVSYGLVRVAGSGLEVTEMTGERLAISGRIMAVHLSRRDENGNR